jgi:hypothetical protein
MKAASQPGLRFALSQLALLSSKPDRFIGDRGSQAGLPAPRRL